MIRKIIFATNFTPLSRRALEFAVALARKTKARLVGAYALRLPLPVYSLEVAPRTYRKELEAASRARLEAFFQRSEVGGLPVETRLCLGTPAQELSRLGRREKADLLVVAKHSRSTLERFFIASTTEQILRESRVPVLVVPDGPRPGLRWNPVCCAVDFSDAALRALKFAIGMARHYRLDLALIHVLELGGGLEALGDRSRVAVERLPERILARLRELAETFGAPKGTQAVVAQGKPSEAVVAEAARLGSDLLIVGRTGNSGLEAMSVGTTAGGILRGAHCPVIVIPGYRS